MTETITWHNAAHEVPDADTTVLVCSPDGTEPVSLGFFCGAWHLAEAPHLAIAVTFWSEVPEGPIG